MAYTDFAFYGSGYFGDTLTEETSPKWLERASDELDAITFGRLTFAFPTVEAHAVKVKKAVCAIAEALYWIDVQRRASSAQKAEDGSYHGAVASISPDGNPFPIRRAARIAPFMLPPRQAQRHKQI